MAGFGNGPVASAPECQPQDALRLVTEGAVLLDVREDDEWAAGHAGEALHIPLGELGQRLDQLEHGQTVVCVCRSGGRSALAADALVQLGYEAWNLAGGMTAWAEAGLPLSDSAGQPGVVI